jgi:hypothetical protein
LEISTRTEIHVPRPAEVVFDRAVACETFPRILRPLGPIPGVARAELPGGGEAKPGARRRIELTDGSAIGEEILALERPRQHTYRWLDPPAMPLALLVRRGTGDWTFTPEAGGTRIVWAYRFELSSPLAWPAAVLVVRLFRRWMAQGLAALRELLVDGPATSR